jgi:hypothetical protein
VSELKVGDKVWVLCKVVTRNRKDNSSWVEVGSKCGRVWVNDSDCRPVEPASSPKILDGSSDPVNPSHYKHLPAEAIDIIEAAIARAPSNQYAFLQGQVIKYLLRCWSKKGIEDLRKAKWYLDRLVSGFDDLLAEASGANDGPAVKRYRQPKQSDLANGPIPCESRDHESHDWKTRMLTDILDGPGYPFLCLNAGANNALRYAQCRIEVGE